MPIFFTMNGKNTKTFTVKTPHSFFWIFDAYWEKDADPLLIFYTQNTRVDNQEMSVSIGFNKENALRLRNYLNEKLGEEE